MARKFPAPSGMALRTQLLSSAQAMHVDLWLLGPERQEMDARQRLGGCCLLGSQGATGSAAAGGGGGGGAALRLLSGISV